MYELDFVREERLQDAWQDVLWNFMEDLERESERGITYFLNKLLRIEADRQLQARPYERTLERLDYAAGYRERSVITPKGTYSLKVPKARSTPLRFSVFDRYQRFWKRVNQMLCEIFLGGCSTRRTGEVLLGTRVSAQTVSRAVQALSPLVERVFTPDPSRITTVCSSSMP